MFSSRFASPDLYAFDFDEGLVTVDASGTLRVFDALAAALWHALAEGHDPDQLVADIAAARGDPAGAAAQDLITLWRKVPDPVPVDDLVPPIVQDCDLVQWYARLCGLDLVMEAEPDQARWLGTILPDVQTDDHDGEHRISIIPNGAGRQALFVDGFHILTTDEPDLLQGAIYQACLDLVYEKPDWRALMHGAAVALEGAAIGLPAPSGSGKSTLTALLLARGYTYLADDLLAVLPDGKAAPWPTAISVKPGSLDIVEKAWPGVLEWAPRRFVKGLDTRLLSVSKAQCAASPLPLHALIMPRYDTQGDNRLMRLRPLRALAELASDRLWIGYPLTPSRVIGFARWLEQMPCYMIRYNSLDRVDEAIRAVRAGHGE